MRVKELIEKLQQCDPEAIVILEGDYSDRPAYSMEESDRYYRSEKVVIIS